MAAHGAGQGIDSFADPLLEQGEEDVFLALEIGVESAARVAGAGGDIFQARGFKTVLRENLLGGGQEFAPGGLGPLGLAGAGLRASEELLRVRFPRAVAWTSLSSRRTAASLDIIHTCMYLTWVFSAVQVLIASSDAHLACLPWIA